MPWSPPKSVTVEQVSDARGYVAAVTAERTPVDGEYLASRLAVLMSQFFVAIDSDRMKKLVAADWIDALREFPGSCVHHAVSKWRNDNKTKPTIAHIRELCIEHYGTKAWQTLQRAKTIASMTPTFMAQGDPKEEVWMPPTAEEKARVAEMLKGIGIGGVGAKSETVVKSESSN